MLMFLLPKVILLTFMFGEDVYRFCVKIFKITFGASEKLLPGRRKFIAQLALGIASIPFASFLYGITKGKYNFKVLKYELVRIQVY